MPYDAGAAGAEQGSVGAHKRGPLRPERLTSARSRLGGDALARLFQLGDIVLLLGLVIASRLGVEFGGATASQCVGSALLVASLVGFEAYKFGARETLRTHVFRVLAAVACAGFVMLIAASLMSGGKAVNTLPVLNWCLAAAIVLTASHLGWFGYIRRLRSSGQLSPNLMIVGATGAAGRLVSAALASRDVNILGVFDDRGGARKTQHIFGVPVLGKTSDVKSHRLLPYVDRIVIAVPSGATARIAELLAELAPVPNAISLLMDGLDLENEQEAHDRLLNMPLALLSGARSGVMQAVTKRAVDLVISAVGCVVLFPALVAIAIAIRLDGPGPVFFKQRRHGYLNEEVLVWKFRSMRVDKSAGAAVHQVTAGDDRVTRIGRFLRRTSLDELPQLWNVLRGEMSLVGPRPHAIGMLTEGAEASKLVETYAHRHRMKPGLTGWAAVNGSRGPVDTLDAVRRRVSLDLEYIERQSLWFDLTIMVRTLPCILGDGAVVR